MTYGPDALLCDDDHCRCGGCSDSITRPGPTVYRNGPLPVRDVAGEWDRRAEEDVDQAVRDDQDERHPED